MYTRFKYSPVLLILSFLIIFSGNSIAHCDSMEGPVVKASQKALETGNINYVLIWVRPEDELTIREIFDKVIKVRSVDQDSKELADLYFFETVVRIHRMGEGVGYTGLKPVGYQPEIGIETADIAINENSVSIVLKNTDEEYHSELVNKFNELQSKKDYNINDLTAGREYVASYVHFIHYVESLFNGEQPQQEHNEHHL